MKVHLRMIPSGVSEAGRDFGYAPVVFRRGETSSLLTTLRTTTQEAPQLMRCGYFAGPAGSLESFEAARQIARDFKPITTQPSVSVGALSAIKPSDCLTDARCFGGTAMVERRLRRSHCGVASTLGGVLPAIGVRSAVSEKKTMRSRIYHVVSRVGGAFGG